MSKTFSIGIFILFFGAIFGATLYFSPGWGLMDDFQNLELARQVLNSSNPALTFIQNIWDSTMGWGIFRPVYHLWIFIIYNLFSHTPTAIYIVMAFINFFALLIWGRVIYKVYNVSKEHYYTVVYFFPLCFFLFTPFWNVFMYISLQEKFIILFSGLSLLFFRTAYETQKRRHVGAAIMFLVLGLLSKPTTIAMLISYIAFCLLDLFLFKIKQRLSLTFLVIYSFLFGLYSLFTLKIQMKGFYTATYGHNLKPAIMLGKIISSPLLIKSIFMVGIMTILWIVIRFIITRKNNRCFEILFPLALLAFLTLLTPWGFQSYLLCDLAPLIGGVLFSLYYTIYQKNRLSGWGLNITIVVMLILVLFGIIFPRISKMGDIAKAEEFIKNYSTQQQTRYFLAPPFEEAAYALKGFLKLNIVYLNDGQITPDKLLGAGDNILLFNDQCSSVLIKDVHIDKQIYSNKTWKIYRLALQNNNVQTVSPKFEINVMQRIKSKLHKF